MDQADARVRSRQTALWTFSIASVLAIGLGAFAMAQEDVPLSIWIRNPVAWAVAAALSLGLARFDWLFSVLAPIALAIVAASFIAAGQEGVHRWLDLGPVQLNAAALVLPAALVAFERTRPMIAVPVFALIALLLAWQPDISQLAGFAPAAVILFTVRFGWRGAAAAIAVAGAMLGLCLSRPDPLAPVAHVEGIFALAWSLSPVLAIAMGVSLGAAALSPLLILLSHRSGVLTPLALAAYFVATALAPFFGAYPVPLAGYGLSFVLGWWLGLALLAKPAFAGRASSK
ncbi:MAG: hypothetical protein QM773_10135 [Hyphomonadaceae bacterium]